jgi:chorismate mutase
VSIGSTHRCRALGILLLVGLSGCYRPSAPTTDQAILDRLLQLMQQRLLLMHDVARWKWNQKQAIADPKREQAFLERMQEKAQTHGLNEEFARSFFRAQIEAAKQVQEDDFQRWQAEGRGSFVDVPDLPTLQRQRIDQASDELLSALAAARPFLESADMRVQLGARAVKVLAGDGITSRVCRMALQPLETPQR